jgi:sarcosine oxidase
MERMDGTFDVAVVGLGAMGSAVADQLARRGCKVLGLDRFVPPHSLGSSHGETRITRRAVGEGEAYVPLVTASHRIWREIEAETGRPLFTECGTLVVGPASIESGFVHRTLAVAEQFGIPHERLDGAGIASRFPFMTGLDGALACFEPGGGYVRPEHCIDAQLTRARASGATLCMGEPVVGIRQEAAGVLIETDKRTWRADRIVMTAGAWNARILGAPFDRLLMVDRQVLHWFALEERAPFTEASPVYIRMHGPEAIHHFYGFPPLPGERRVKVATEQFATSTDPDAVRRDVDPAESDALFEDHLRGRLAGVQKDAVETAVCLYTVTPDGGFIVDRHPDMDRVTIVSACSGHGFKHSAGLGEALARRLCGETQDIDLTPFALARFRA